MRVVLFGGACVCCVCGTSRPLQSNPTLQSRPNSKTRAPASGSWGPSRPASTRSRLWRCPTTTHRRRARGATRTGRRGRGSRRRGAAGRGAAAPTCGYRASWTRLKVGLRGGWLVGWLELGGIGLGCSWRGVAWCPLLSPFSSPTQGTRHNRTPTKTPPPKGASAGALHTRLDLDTGGLFLSYSHASPAPSDATFNLKDLR